MARKALEDAMPGFAFVKFVVRDLHAMRAFYERALQLVAVRTIDTPAITEILMRPQGETEGFCLVLYKSRDDRAVTLGDAHGPLGFYVESASDAFENALREGAAPLKAPFEISGLRVAFVRDPEGHELEFLERL
jgi:lactoylglutathione lyase